MNTQAVSIADGNFTMSILPYTPSVLPEDANNESQIAFGVMPGISNSVHMTDNSPCMIICGPEWGVIDGVAGNLGMSISGGAISFTSFQVDPILGTAGGDFSQSANDTSMMSGVTNATTTSFDLTGRVASMSALGITDKKWDYAGFTTDTVSNAAGSDTGVPVTNVGDINGDGIDDYTAVFKAAGEFGPEWGFFQDAPYFEVWNTEIVSMAPPVPLPAAVWLFGSGLLGLFAWGRRK
ncbi:MAG: VPLPA-CTERM sorting domain-containing protein [Gammaproteobacteria bacterium]|nr:VPLPA-CTERM sorting domain-containing protein [Gammaproteobacteria bacterium]